MVLVAARRAVQAGFVAVRAGTVVPLPQRMAQHIPVQGQHPHPILILRREPVPADHHLRRPWEFTELSHPRREPRWEGTASTMSPVVRCLMAENFSAKPHGEVNFIVRPDMAANSVAKDPTVVSDVLKDHTQVPAPIERR